MGFRKSPVENLAMNPEFWNKKRVFITGHTGFKGSWLSLWLQHLGAELTGFALGPPTTPSLFKSAKIDQGMASIIGDIRDLPALQGAIERSQPEIIIHMAAQPLVRDSYERPVETYSTNVMGTVHVLEVIRHVANIATALIVTSDKCYASNEINQPHCETDTLGGKDPYSNSKSCAELVTMSYRASFFSHDNYRTGTSIASARAGNVIGGGDWAKDRLLPDMMEAFKNKKPVTIRNPDAVRPWQHVLEPLIGYLSLLERLHQHKTTFASAWNFGPPNDQHESVRTVVSKVAELWGDGATWQQETSYSTPETDFLRLDSSKAIDTLEWAPRWSLDKALKSTVAWQKAFLRGEDMFNVSLEQIQDFSSPN